MRELKWTGSSHRSGIKQGLVVLIVISEVFLGSCLVFKNGVPEYLESQQGRSLIGPGGVLLDIPKVRVLRYKVKNTQANVVSDELDCENRECGDIIEPPLNKFLLGSNSAKEAGDWSLPPNVTQIVFECKSRSGPVEWEYEGNGVLTDLDIENTRHVGDFWSPSTYLHISLLKLAVNNDQITGKYTCRNVDKTNKANSFYLFVPQPKSEVINDGRKIEIIPPSHADEIVIPCRMEKRQTPVYLFKKSPDGNYRRIVLKGSGRFDPYQGFILPLTDDVYGDYSCKVDKKRRKKTKRDVTTVTISPPIAMLPPGILINTPTIEPARASPGFSAFPNSAELAEIVKTEEDAKILTSMLTSSSEYSTIHPDLVIPPVPTMPTPNLTQFQETLPWQPVKRKNRPGIGRRRKRPFMRPRQPGIHANVLSRRTGPGMMPPQFHRPYMNYPHRRPVYGRPHMAPHYDPQMMSHSNQMSISNVLQHPLQQPSHYHGHHIPSSHPVQSPGLAYPRLPSGQDLDDNKSYVPGSLEAFSGSSSPYQNFIGETLMSRVDTRPSTIKPPTKSKPISLFPQNLLPPTNTVISTMQCVLKKMVLGADVPCNASLADGIAERHGSTSTNTPNNLISDLPPVVKEQKTILEVSLVPPPENKFFPAVSPIFTTTPFFVKWETKFTDYANWAEANHTLKEGAFKRHRAEKVAHFENGINALEVFDVPVGETGNITVTYMVGRKDIRTHTWHYFIINETTNSNKGLKQTVDGVVKVFMCRSATSKRPVLSLSRLSDNGCPEPNKDPFSGVQDYTEEDCGVGCTLLRTKIEQGVVKCTGDGVDQTLMFPEEVQCTGRPYFIDRGKEKNLTLTAKGNRLLIPCIINNPNADVYLFHEEDGVMTEVTDNSTFDLKSGFYLDTSGMKDPYGIYLCTSTPDTDDHTDMVRYHVNPVQDYEFFPPQETVFGPTPFKFMWESVDELEVVNSSIGKFEKGMFAKSDGARPHIGTFQVFGNFTDEEDPQEIQVVRKSDQKVVHTWRFKYMSKIGLTLDKEKNLFRCQAASENQPMLYAVPCDNPNVCKLERKYYDDEEEDIRVGKENSHCGDGCVQLKIWRDKPLGFVRCKGDGVDETLQYFLTENSTLLTEEEKPSLEEFKTPEIVNGIRRLRVGETADFICKGSRYFYSKGFQWAIETRNGQRKFIDAKVREDVLVRDQVRSVINLKILDAEWKSVWCYTPELMSNNWANISQPIYLR